MLRQLTYNPFRKLELAIQEAAKHSHPVVVHNNRITLLPKPFKGFAPPQKPIPVPVVPEPEVETLPVWYCVQKGCKTHSKVMRPVPKGIKTVFPLPSLCAKHDKLKHKPDPRTFYQRKYVLQHYDPHFKLEK